MTRPIVYHIPVCPFCQRLEILLALKEQSSAVEFRVIDITQPRPGWLLEKTGGTTSLPVLEAPSGDVLRESLVLLRYLDQSIGPRISAEDPLLHAIENLLVVYEREFVNAGYNFILNQDPARRGQLEREMLEQYAALDAFLSRYAKGGPFLLGHFGWAEAVFTPMFMRFWFLEYYEGFELPANPRYERVRAFRDACIAHPAAQQVTREQIVKVYYDYARGAGNGALVPGRSRSSFAFQPHWSERPWPPQSKLGSPASDAELGLLR
jgi:glutathione S-transferase